MLEAARKLAVPEIVQSGERSAYTFHNLDVSLHPSPASLPGAARAETQLPPPPPPFPPSPSPSSAHATGQSPAAAGSGQLRPPSDDMEAWGRMTAAARGRGGPSSGRRGGARTRRPRLQGGAGVPWHGAGSGCADGADLAVADACGGVDARAAGGTEVQGRGVAPGQGR